MGYYIAGNKIRPNIGRIFIILVVLSSALALTTVYRLNTFIAAAVTPPDSCFAFAAGTISGYYDNQNDDPGQAACPRNVDIPSTIGGINVTTIDNAAFAGKSLTALTLPSTLTTIASYAFAGNPSLVALSIPDSVTSIGGGIASGSPIATLSIGTIGFSGTPTLIVPDSAFINNGITSLTLGNNIVTIDDFAFRLNNIPSVEVPASVTTIGEFAFSDSGISSLTLHEGLVTIEESAFHTNNIDTLLLPDSVQALGLSAFQGNSIDTLDLGSVQTIANEVFMENNLTTLTIPNTVIGMGYASFQDNPLTSITIGTSDFSGTPLLEIGGQFNGNGVEEVFFGNNVLTIGVIGNAFVANQITQVTIPGSVTVVGGGSFPANQLESIVIEDGVGEINAGAFAGNDPLTTATIHGNPILDNAAFDGSGNGNFIQMFATNPTFAAAHAPGFFDNVNNYGYVVNPATYTVNYQSSTGDVLAPQLISGISPTLTDYSIAANPTGDFGLYYIAGDEIPLSAPDIDGYITPSAYSLNLVAGPNTYTFVYVAIVNDANDSEDLLADTGASQPWILSIASLVGIAGLLTTKRYIANRHP